MFDLLRRHATTVIVAMVTAAVTAGGPAIARTVADFARNSDQVDGRHAVGAGATSRDRAGKLVATNAAGRLPNNIIAKAPNADRLDGASAAAFARAQVPRDALLRGEYYVRGDGNLYSTHNLILPMRAGIPASNVQFLSRGSAGTAQCPGSGRAARGYLCVYERRHLGDSIFVMDPVTHSIPTPGDPSTGTSRYGFVLSFFAYGQSVSAGEWVLRAP